MKQLEVEYRLADGREGTIEIPNRSRIQWDLTAPKRKWPSPSDAPSMWATFLTWDALLRAEIYTGKWEEFMDDCLVADVIGDEDDAPDVDPTAPDQTPI